MNRILPCPEDDNQVNVGVLTNDEIKHCVEKFKLIDPFDEQLLKPARYKLTLGEDYAMGGERRKLYNEPGKDTLTIQPFQVAIVSTRETLNMPRFLIARWNLDIHLVYEGLLWVGGPQVDPGYCGRLFCPLYNLSNKPVTLRFGQVIATIDFIKTTPFKRGKSIEYPYPPKRQTLDDYNTRLESALFVEVKQKIDNMEQEVKEQRQRIENIEDRVGRYLSNVFTVLGILIAAISLIVTKFEFMGIPAWGWCALLLSILAILLSPSIHKLLKRLADSS
jgi:deoxycytidine triphosphate deaminase